MNPPRRYPRTVWPGAPGGSHRPRLLFLSCHLPWPPVSGGRRRELELIERLAGDYDIHLLVISKTPEQDLANADLLATCCREVEVFAAQPPAGAAGDLPVQVARHRSTAATERVAEIVAARGADLVHVEGFYLMQHLPEAANVPVLLVEQNIEYDLEHQRAGITPDSDTRFSLFSSGRRTRAAELQSWRAATRVATVTADDRNVIEAELPGAEVSVVPDGADHVPACHEAEPCQTIERPDSPLIALVANFAYAPNVDAAQHLCRDIVALLRETVPHTHTWLVGNAPPPEVQALAGDGITVTGYVSDVPAYLDAVDVVVCPLRIGGGIKVKTIEALRRGKAIVSTPIGAQGLGPQARHALLVESEPRRFAGAVASLLVDAERRAGLERRAAQSGAMLPSWQDSAGALDGVYAELLDRAPPSDAKPLAIAAGGSA